MDKITKKIEPLDKVEAEIRLPGSKSITHRALLMSALAKGESIIQNPLVAEDTLLTASALQQLGVTVRWAEDTVHVEPPNQRWTNPRAAIILGNSGTSMRLLLALAATGTGTFTFDGSHRLRERPIGPILEALGELGVDVTCLKKAGYPPVVLRTQGLKGGEVWVDARQSSQFLSALLIAAPCAQEDMRIGWQEPVASFPYVSITLAMMEQLGIVYRWLSGRQLAIPAPQVYAPVHYEVEGDCSSASYFWAAAALTAGDVYTYPVVPQSPQGDCRLLEVLKQMGCTVQWQQQGVRITGTPRLQPLDLDMNEMPDMVPTLAVLAACAHGRSQIRNVAHLRVKESDRLHVVATELSKFGIAVQELADGLIIDGGAVRSPKTAIESHDDHRIAMAFAVLGLRVKGVEIRGAEAVAKSFPQFWNIFDHFY